MQIFPVKRGQNCSREQLWKHALLVAGIARFIAAQLHMDEGCAFTAGLLHDIGKLIFNESFALEMQEVLHYCQEHDSYNFEAEQKILGIDHMQLGAKLAHHWKLPRDIVEAIAGHHGTAEASYNEKLVALVNLSDLLFHSLDIIHQEQTLLPPLIVNCLANLNISWSRIQEWLPEIETQIQHYHSSYLAD
jgi:putative nucleotidyltransferase with HDIG domain